MAVDTTGKRISTEGLSDGLWACLPTLPWLLVGVGRSVLLWAVLSCTGGLCCSGKAAEQARAQGNK